MRHVAVVCIEDLLLDALESNELKKVNQRHVRKARAVGNSVLGQKWSKTGSNQVVPDV